MKNNTLPLRLQYFASEQTGNEGGRENEPQNPSGGQQNTQQTQAVSFDYEKLASIVTGKQNVAEDTVLKNYFKQQGLSQEEAAQAMQQFKEQKARNTPDVDGIQTQLAEAQKEARQAAVEKEAVLEAVALGVDIKTVPYLIKLADLSTVLGADGKVNGEAIKNALNKVLEDIPQMKPQKEDNKGFRIGGGGQQETSQNDQLASIFGNKK